LCHINVDVNISKNMTANPVLTFVNQYFTVTPPKNYSAPSEEFAEGHHAWRCQTKIITSWDLTADGLTLTLKNKKNNAEFVTKVSNATRFTNEH